MERFIVLEKTFSFLQLAQAKLQFASIAIDMVVGSVFLTMLSNDDIFSRCQTLPQVFVLQNLKL
jgi:hypothetical protein